MGRETRKTTRPAIGSHAKNRHSKLDRIAKADPAVYSTLNALKQAPTIKHKTHYEIFENTDKKEKKLETQITTDRVPPPGYEFLAAGNPELTTLCKDISREQDAMIFIVSDSSQDTVSAQTHRLGWHFRERIVDQAREKLKASGHTKPQKTSSNGHPESIPKSREQIFKEADAVLRDLFPRIPNISRMEILKHSFDKDNKLFNGKEKVGMAEDLPLARRVQLAALSHIRHTMTRYDDLLREGQRWENARRAVEKPCLDIIVKWRGDEETGRDQLDEILREVIEISDDEDSETEDSSEGEALPHPLAVRAPRDIPEANTTAQFAMPRLMASTGAVTAQASRREPSVIALDSPPPELPRKLTRKERKAAKQSQQRFRRYAQVAETFRQHPVAGGQNSPRDDNMSSNTFIDLSRHRTGNMDSPQPVRYVAVSSAPSYNEGQPYHVPPQGGTRLRGQSPVLVRVAEHPGPKVGSGSDRQGYGQTPVSPVRNQFQDMLVRSIEPCSPGVQRYQNSPSSYFPPEGRRVVEAPQIISRTVVEQPPGRAYSGAAGYATSTDNAPLRCRRVIAEPGGQSDLFSGAGFIQLHRDTDRRVIAQDYMAERPQGHGIPVSREYRPEGHGIPVSREYRPEGHGIPISREYQARVRSPAMYTQEPSRTTRSSVVYRPRSGPIYVGQPESHHRDEVLLRSRDHPIVLNNSPVISRNVDVPQRWVRSGYAQSHMEQPDVVRGPPIHDVRHASERRSWY